MLWQVDQAFEYLTRMQEADQPDVRYEVSVTRGDTQARGRGVYLREPADSARPVRFTAKVEATFHEVRSPPYQPCFCTRILVISPAQEACEIPSKRKFWMLNFKPYSDDVDKPSTLQ